MTTFPKIYTVNGPSSTSSSTLPTWITTKPRSVRPAGSTHRKRVKTQREIGQLELIQDFAFPEAAIKIKTTEDGDFAIGTGTYKPMMKVWDLHDLTVKFERVTDAENVDFVILSSDWTKTLHLQRDRSISLHTQMGLHHSLRLPTYGRSLAYHAPSAEALIGCTGSEVFRLNLEEGRYMVPIKVQTDDIDGVNVVDVNSRHGLWSLGLDGGSGIVEFWDPRSKSALTKLLLPTSTLLPMQPHYDGTGIIPPEQTLSVTALASHPTDGLSLAVGTSTGHTLLYDLRSPTPFAIKDQGYGEPMKNVEWLRSGGGEDEGRVISADSKVVKIWNKKDASSNLLSLQPPSTLTHLHAVPNSGLIFTACDAPQLNTYYIPDLGPAPRWAGFLDNVTEEMAQDASGGIGKSAYVDYKFIDRQELETLGLTHLIGTQTLKPYMHGFFISLKLYTTARLIANPTSYAEQREKMVADKLAAKAESRIRARKDQPKVNKALAERLRRADDRAEAAEKRKREKKAAAAVGAEDGANDGAEEGGATARSGETLLSDPRFKDLFEDPDFEVDEESREFALLNPATANKNAARKTAVEDEEDESDRMSSDLSEDEDDSEDDDDGGGGQAEDPDEDSEESDDGELLQYDPRNVKRTTAKPFARPESGPLRKPRLIIGDERHAGPSSSDTFGKRAWSQQIKPTKASKKDARMDGVLAMRRGTDGGMEMSFVPQGSSKSRAGAENDWASDDDDLGPKGGRPNRSKVERFGAGMERGQEDQSEAREGDRGGRTRRRDVSRSASKNTFRRK
ncbi:WD40-repeat-containing domain protein [Kockovaella imperatae]|uniref:WD40-repeat-containing domain protein n=1 Tax=Kockovaella imperatae TaxID=4999 RepID=A0A1Y1U787_9TREE|nr:WD40-repeat-containing domain protein [Kockovaella imperatae]ORX33872.1 WD40-repeat-containing domain protein [Kockovaella imperatae]